MARKSCRILLGMLIGLATFFEFAIFRATLAEDARGLQRDDVGRQSVAPSSGGGVRICRSASRLFDNDTALEVAIERNFQFHQRGGNMEAIDRYLNLRVDATLEALGVTYTPGGAAAPVASGLGGPPLPEGFTHSLQDHYATHDVKGRGYGQPLPGSLTSERDPRIMNKALFEKRWVNVLEGPTAARFHHGVGPVGPDCPRTVVFSEGTYERKDLCVAARDPDDPPPIEVVWPVTPAPPPEEDCHIVAIGSNDQWAFEQEVMDKMPGCVTHTFDCTLRNHRPRRKPLTDNVKFYPYCIGTADARPPYATYQKIWEETHTKTPPKLLKMDIEGFEYMILPAILSSPPEIWPEQIMLEVHWATRMVDLAWMPRTRTAAEIALFFGGLFNRGGYIVSHTATFPGCQACMEVTLVRAVC